MTFARALKVVAWQGLNPLLLNLKKNRQYDIEPDTRGINIGCGLDNPPGWLGIDGGITHYLVKKAPIVISRLLYRAFNSAGNHSFAEYREKVTNMSLIHHELEFGLPFADESVPNVFSSHFFEHLWRADAAKLMAECYRVLRQGGMIRICVPDLDKTVTAISKALEDYQHGDVVSIQTYVTSSAASYRGPYSFHKWMYNFLEMERLLRESGFRDIRREDYKVGRILDVELLDTRAGLYVEATK